MGKRRDRKTAQRAVVIGLVLLSAVLAGVWLLLGEVFRDHAASRTQEEIPRGQRQEVPPDRSRGVPRAAVLIDDIGYDLRVLESLLKVPAPVSFAVLPAAPHATEAANRIHGAGRDVLLHLPMEPRQRRGNGKNGLTLDMADEAMAQQIRRGLQAVPHAKGINNHEGSRFTEHEERLTALLLQVQARNLFFVDSRTSPSSSGERAAQKVGIPFAARTAFIDQGVEQTLQEIRRYRPAGDVLLIGHPYPNTAHSLGTLVSRLRRLGYVLVPVSALVVVSVEHKNGKEQGT